MVADFTNMTNWSRGLRRSSVILFLAAVGILYLDLTKPKFDSKADLTFISGPFTYYTVYNAGKTHSFSFTLKNYSNVFYINTDYLRILNFAKFSKIKYGTMLRLGFLTASLDDLNNGDKMIFVYSISDNYTTYMNWKETIKWYNNPYWKLFSLILFIMAVFCYSYAVKIDRN